MIRKVLVLDPDPVSQQKCARLLRDCRCEATLADSAAAAKACLGKQKFDAALMDFQVASANEFALPTAAQHAGIHIILTVDAQDVVPVHLPLRLHGYALLTRPLKIEDLTRALESGRELSPSTAAPIAQERKITPAGFADMVGESEKMQKIFRLVSKVALQRHPVLILGESGTGKELVARAIHDHGPLRDQPFVPIDCGALPPTLIESELFGHLKGAFTGAAQARQGLLAAAGSGTVFLDEIGELPLELQSRLLRALQEHEIRPLGSNLRVKFEARIVAATNRDLEARIKTGSFRKDLYFRVNVVTVRMPALRDRREDIPGLVRFFVDRYDTNHPKIQISDNALAGLMGYSWPGNIRELGNCIQRMISLGSGKFLELKDLPSYVLYQVRRTNSSGRETGSLEALEQRAIQDALKATSGDRIRAAKILGIGKTTIYRKLKEYGIESHAAEA